jgi:uncharacterized protein (TIGR02246 family)
MGASHGRKNEMSARSPEEVDKLFVEAMNAGNLEAALALFEDDGSFATEQGEVLHGKSAFRPVMEGFFALQPRLDLQIKRVVRSGDTAVTYGAGLSRGPATTVRSR